MRRILFYAVMFIMAMPPVNAQTAQQLNGHEYVDLGLPSGTKWATCNVGAQKASDYGDFYTFGALKPEAPTPFDGESTVNPITGNPTYDVARAQWGEGWQMPTKAQFEELNTKCKWVWRPMNGIKGYRVTGPNGNSIFLPAGGIYFSDYINFGGRSGYYWTATPVGEYGAFYLFCGEVLNEMDDIWERPTHYVGDGQGAMCYRMTIRPVTK